MPLPQQLLDEMAERSRAAETRARIDSRVDLTLTALTCMLIAALGIALIGFAIHTTNQWLARVSFWSGIALGNSGIIYTLLAAYRRGERRGDW